MSHHRTQSLSPLQHTSLQMSHKIFFFFRFRSVFYTMCTYVVWKNVQLSHNNIKNDRWWWIDVCVCVCICFVRVKRRRKIHIKKMLPRISENKIRLFSLFFLFFDYFYIIFFSISPLLLYTYSHERPTVPF